MLVISLEILKSFRNNLHNKHFSTLNQGKAMIILNAL